MSPRIPCPRRQGRTSAGLTVPVLLVLCSLAAQLATATETTEPSDQPRVVVVGDIHGALGAFKLILRRAGLLNGQDQWIGGTDVLVQTGDFLDRGAEARGAAELLQELQRQAKRDGGRVVVLLGNHEALNLGMDLRDVTPDIAARFAGKRSEKRRQRYCERLKRRAGDKARGEPEQDPLETCLSEVPAGLLEYIDALSPEKSLGRWLRKLPVVVEVEGWLFVHGGLSPEWADMEIEAINDRAQDELERFDRLRTALLRQDLILPTSSLKEIAGVARALMLVVKERDLMPHEQPLKGLSVEDLESAADLSEWTLFDPDGPLWFRGYAKWSDSEMAAAMPAILEAQGARGVVVGHTPSRSRSIESRFDHRVLLIDTGMLKNVYGGRPAALEIIGDAVFVIYPEKRERIGTVPGP